MDTRYLIFYDVKRSTVKNAGTEAGMFLKDTSLAFLSHSFFFLFLSQTNYILSRSCTRDPIDNRQNNAAGLNAVSFYRVVLHIHVDISRSPSFFFVLKIHPHKNGG